MAITTLDGIVAGGRPPMSYGKALSGNLVAGRPYSPFYAAGVPGAAVAPTPGLGGAALTTYAGQIPVPAASNNTYISDFLATSSAQAGVLYLCDRLWHNSGMSATLTTAETINSVAWPARDANGTINGDRVLIGVEVSTATGAGVPTITINYTNSVGTAGKTATNIQPTVASSAVGTFYQIGLAAGDVGVRSIQTKTLSATWTSGVYHLVAYRIIAAVPCIAPGLPAMIDSISHANRRLLDNSVLFPIFVPSATTTTQLSGLVGFTQG
jgi:hypothetical protein